MIAASTYNPGGSYGDESTILVWDLASRERLFTLTDPGGAGTGMVFSPDESVLIAANHNFGTVNLFDLDLGAKISTLEAHVASPEGVAVSKDGSVLAVGSGAYETDTDSKDFSIKLYDLAGQEKGKLRGHTNSVTCLAFRPDGETLASGSEDGTIKVWDVASRSELFELTGVSDTPPTSVAYSPDGRVLAIGSGTGAVQLWEFAQQEVTAKFPGETTSVFRVEFSPDGDFVAAAYYGVTLWDVAGEKEIARLGGPNAGDAMTFSPDGQLAVVGEKGTIDLWKIR
jgi:WD40 repeat protein